MQVYIKVRKLVTFSPLVKWEIWKLNAGDFVFFLYFKSG